MTYLSDFFVPVCLSIVLVIDIVFTVLESYASEAGRASLKKIRIITLMRSHDRYAVIYLS
jgi:hypothetical protein